MTLNLEVCPAGEPPLAAHDPRKWTSMAKPHIFTFPLHITPAPRTACFHNKMRQALLSFRPIFK
jgi:hypothetical protein